MYEFSAPMPYTIEDIDKILAINNQVKRSKITSLYACVPRGCELFTGFEQSRNFSFNDTSWNYWKGLIEYTLSKGCDFIYLLNSPRPLNTEHSNFTTQIEKLKKLLSELMIIGVKSIRIASPQLISYITKLYPDFNIFLSTSLEYKTIWEYENFFYSTPNVKQFVPSHDINKNFKLLSILKKSYPNIDIELMVNEGCLQGCPYRISHEHIDMGKNIINANNKIFYDSFLNRFCFNILDKYPIESLIIGNLIFPWDIKEYTNIGINKFKFVGREGYAWRIQDYLLGFSVYLQAIENMQKIKYYNLSVFSHHLNQNLVLKQLSIKDYKKYLPKISHFKKYGHLCASRCGVECRYCYKCAEKIQKVFEKKQLELKKRNIPVCY